MSIDAIELCDWKRDFSILTGNRRSTWRVNILHGFERDIGWLTLKYELGKLLYSIISRLHFSNQRLASVKSQLAMNNNKPEVDRNYHQQGSIPLEWIYGAISIAPPTAASPVLAIVESSS